MKYLITIALLSLTSFTANAACYLTPSNTFVCTGDDYEGGDTPDSTPDINESVAANATAIDSNREFIRGNAVSIHDNAVNIHDNASAIDDNSVAIKETAGNIQRNEEKIHHNTSVIDRNKDYINYNASNIEYNYGLAAGNRVAINALNDATNGHIDSLYRRTLSNRQVLNQHAAAINSAHNRIDGVIDLVAQQRTYLTGLISNNTALASLTDDHISVAVGGQQGSVSLAIGSAFKVGNFTVQFRTAYNSGIKQGTSSLGIGYSF